LSERIDVRYLVWEVERKGWKATLRMNSQWARRREAIVDTTGASKLVLRRTIDAWKSKKSRNILFCKATFRTTELVRTPIQGIQATTMADSSPAPEPLKFVPDRTKQYPKFQSYKLEPYSEDKNLKRIPLPVPPSQAILPTNARVVFQDVRVRTGWNHLSQGWEGKSVLYVGTDGEIVRILGEEWEVLAKIPMGSREDVYGYSARVIEIAPEFFIATDGLGRLFAILNRSVIGSLQEEVPFILFDAKWIDGQVYVLVCQGTGSVEQASTSHHLKGNYTLRKLRLKIPLTIEYKVDTALIGTEIPQHAILTPDILVVSQSPFRMSIAPVDPENMTIYDITPAPPFYTYYQTLTDLEISIPIPVNTPKSAIELNFSNSGLQLRFLPPIAPNQPDLTEFFPFQTIKEKQLWGQIDQKNSMWTLSSSSTAMVLDIHLEKLPEQQSRWPQVFREADGAEEYIDPSDRRGILARLEKYHPTSGRSDDEAVRRRFLLEEDEDIDSVYQGDVVQLFKGSKAFQLIGHDLLALPFAGPSLGLKLSIDMCVFEEGEGHVRTFPAFSFVASSKRLRKYCRYGEEYVVIVESGRGGNLYAYYLPEDGVLAKQVVLRLGVESIGVGMIQGDKLIILGEVDDVFEVVIVGGL
jgi:hypothetical protein